MHAHIYKLAAILTLTISETTAAELKAARPITNDDCLGFAARMEYAVAKQKTDMLANLINIRGILDFAIDGIEAPTYFRSQFRNGVLSQTGDLAKQLVEKTNKNGSYQFVRIRGGQNSKRVLFRFFSPSVGFDYHEYSLARDKGGVVVVSDLQKLARGESAAETLRRVFICGVGANAGWLPKLSQADQDLVRHHSQISRMQTFAKQRQFRAALDVYEALPSSLKRDRVVLDARVESARHVGTSEWKQALADLVQFHGSDASTIFARIGQHRIQGEYDDALVAVEELDKLIGGDAFLNVVRAQLVRMKGNYAAARLIVEPLMENEKLRKHAAQSLYSIAHFSDDSEEKEKLGKLLSEEFGVASK